MLRKGLHVKKNDLVQVMSGHEKGKTGKVTQLIVSDMKVLIEKLNRVKKHTKPTQKNPQGGIIEIEKPIAASSVLLLCPKCNKGVRTGKKEIKGKRVRVCKKCGQQLDKSK